MICAEVYLAVQRRSYFDPVTWIKLIDFVSTWWPPSQHFFLYISTHSLLISSRLLLYVCIFFPRCLLTVGPDRSNARLLSIFNRVLLYSLCIKQRYDVSLLDFINSTKRNRQREKPKTNKQPLIHWTIDLTPVIIYSFLRKINIKNPRKKKLFLNHS